MNTNNLPTLAELHQDVQAAFKNDQFKLLLNQPPHQSWLKKHPLIKSDYLPIDKIEFMLDRIFQEWKIEVLQCSVMFQSITVTVRLHYKSPITGEWSFHDGVGAKSVQVNQGSSAADLSAIKDAAVQMALPTAKSQAIKDAAEHLGSLFGRDLNRKDTIMFAGAYGEQPPESTLTYEQRDHMTNLKNLGTETHSITPKMVKETQANYTTVKEPAEVPTWNRPKVATTFNNLFNPSKL